MIHSRRPLQEKMALFWHNHFATAYSKLAAKSGTVQGAKMLAHNLAYCAARRVRSSSFVSTRWQLSRSARGSGEDPAMLVWLDSDSNSKARPQKTSAVR